MGNAHFQFDYCFLCCLSFCCHWAHSPNVRSKDLFAVDLQSSSASDLMGPSSRRPDHSTSAATDAIRSIGSSTWHRSAPKQLATGSITECLGCLPCCSDCGCWPNAYCVALPHFLYFTVGSPAPCAHSEHFWPFFVESAGCFGAFGWCPSDRCNDSAA